MKKVKVILAAIAVFAVVGGALAFKAKKSALSVYQLDAAKTTCSYISVDFDDAKTTIAGAATIATYPSATTFPTTSTSFCTSTLYLTVE